MSPPCFDILTLSNLVLFIFWKNGIDNSVEMKIRMKVQFCWSICSCFRNSAPEDNSQNIPKKAFWRTVTRNFIHGICHIHIHGNSLKVLRNHSLRHLCYTPVISKFRYLFYGKIWCVCVCVCVWNIKFRAYVNLNKISLYWTYHAWCKL